MISIVDKLIIKREMKGFSLPIDRDKAPVILIKGSTNPL